MGVVVLETETEGLPVGVPASLAVLETPGLPVIVIGLPERVVVILPQGLGERVTGLVEGRAE